MKWTNFTDITTCRTFNHLFYIKKPEYRNDVIEWYVLHDGHTIHEGKTVKMSIAKKICKEIYIQLKHEMEQLNRE